MNESNDKLKLFTTRMRQLILQYKAVKKENEELYAMVDAREKDIEQLRQQLQQAQDDYHSLKMAKMIEVSDGDIEASKKHIASLIREVNKCITLLSEQ
jgi:dephospho-CoA kinase